MTTKHKPQANHLTVLAFGTFDFLHDGHKFFLSEARKLGGKLYVVVARDSNVLKIKGKLPHFNENKRLEMVSEFDIADKVILGSEKDMLAVLHKIKPDMIALGFDQKAPEDDIKKILPNVKIIRLSDHFPQKFKSSILRNHHK